MKNALIGAILIGVPFLVLTITLSALAIIILPV